MAISKLYGIDIGGGGGVSAHADLTGLNNDDHIQYLLMDGTRGFTSTISGATPIEDYHLTTKDYVDTLVATISGADILPAVQARRSTIYLLTNSFSNVTFDITDEETNSVVVEHNNSNTERIDIKSNGVYLIQYNFNVNAPASIAQTSYVEAQLVKNDSITISGSYSKNTTFYDTSIDGNPLFHNQLTNSMITILSSNDYVTLQMKYSNFQTTTASNGTIKVIKLEATSGAEGPPGKTGSAGTGTTINILSDNILTASGISDLNFVSEFNVVDNGLGKATVSGGGGVSSHGSLTDLLNDDHAQYILVDGTRDISGNLTVSGIISTTQLHPIGGASSYIELDSKTISVYTNWKNMIHIEGNAGEIILNPHANTNDVDVMIYGEDGASTKEAYKYDRGDDIHYFNSDVEVSGTISTRKIGVGTNSPDTPLHTVGELTLEDVYGKTGKIEHNSWNVGNGLIVVTAGGTNDVIFRVSDGYNNIFNVGSSNHVSSFRDDLDVGGGLKVEDNIRIIGITEYADNNTAVSGGLTTGDFYRTGDFLKIVH